MKTKSEFKVGDLVRLAMSGKESRIGGVQWIKKGTVLKVCSHGSTRSIGLLILSNGYTAWEKSVCWWVDPARLECLSEDEKVLWSLRVEL